MLQQVPDGVTAQSPMSGHRNVCFACGISILRARTHLVHPDCPEKNVIISWTFPHLVQYIIFCVFFNMIICDFLKLTFSLLFNTNNNK